jgi:anti-sigma B factor antagonist
MSDDVGGLRAVLLHVEARHDDTGATIVVVGEFDMAGCEAFWAHVSEALETQPVSITVEARGLTFIDSSGLAALLRAREAADEAGAAFRVSEPSPAVQRIVEITGTMELLRGE